ncbi:hypothetical protein [Marinicella litoralis]|uniref:Uncharacterized protein n=1 Tax=Marinicella litoralis TaxID=644220 RepID=A0A4R6XU05_9GAMM|nr:hypothetical protein [Marinicella litoralis]TDR23465.1 hypothetical protein C8D91_0326 [Marinicella litoralis]
MSVSLMQLWLPILLGGLFCWIASAIFHMVIKHHNADYKPISNEEQVSDAIHAGDPKPGLYTMPYCVDMKDMGDETVQKKFTAGPVVMLAVFENGLPPMGKLLGQQLLYFIIGCLLIAYASTLALTAGADFMSVFRVVMVTSFLAFGWGLIPFSIWMGHPWSNCIRFLIDALIYGAIVAATFAWLWPAAG